MHIRGLILSLARKYMPWLLEEKRLLEFKTPLITIVNSKNEVTNYFFSFDEFDEYQKKNDITKKKIVYRKGLGSWSASTLEKLIEKIGEDKFFVPFEIDEKYEDMILNWFIDENVDFRKEEILNNKFNVAVI